MMNMYSKYRNASGWLVFAIGLIIYFLTAERSASLWDCGEFILAAYKLEVVHPPGAPLFLLLGRVFSIIGDIFISDPSGPAFGVNMLSGVATAFAACFVCWATIRLVEMSTSKIESVEAKTVLSIGSGLIAGLCTLFSTSIWFSAVEGEVYALSLFFLALTLWSSIKWYSLPDDTKNDKWLIITMYAIGLSIGVHLLSLLVLPVIAMLFCFKKFKKQSILDMALFGLAGVISIGLIQKVLITGIPWLWFKTELLVVNGFGLPAHSGILFVILFIATSFYFGFQYAHRKQLGGMQTILMSALMMVIGYSTIATVVIRANTAPPVNMNNVSDATRLLPYLNREQYGERPILKGTQFDKQAVSITYEDRYGLEGNQYEIIDQKGERVYKESDKVLFPRMSSWQEKDANVYKAHWMSRPNGSPTASDNRNFFFKYQLGWMYFRYFCWNFVGRQNFTQGFSPKDKASGNWMTGIDWLDQSRLYDSSLEPISRRSNPSRNLYFGIPFILGILGIIFHFRKGRKEAFALLAFFIITGIGLIVYTNQPPLEPRERDYVLVGSFMAFCVWIGMALPAMYNLIQQWTPKTVAIALPCLLCLMAPYLMITQNWDDSDRSALLAARDYSKNYLKSCDQNALLFSTADNDTYPVWYVQEVEGFRDDVRVINTTLMQSDDYIRAQRRKVNNSDKIDFITADGSYRGKKRTYLRVKDGKPMSLEAAMKFVGESHPERYQNGQTKESYFPTRHIYIDVDPNYWENELPNSKTSRGQLVNRIELRIKDNILYQNDLALLDMIAANFNKRPIYFNSLNSNKRFGLNKYLQIEGIANRLVPLNKGSNQPLIAKEKTYQNLMDTFDWGNFDNEDMYADAKLRILKMPHDLAFLHTVTEYANQHQREKTLLTREKAKANPNQGILTDLSIEADDSLQKTKDLCNKYFEVFPPEAFGYDANVTLNLINILAAVEAEDSLENIVPGFALYLQDHLDFYRTLDKKTLSDSWTFGPEYNSYQQVVKSLKQISNKFPDAHFSKELENIQA